MEIRKNSALKIKYALILIVFAVAMTSCEDIGDWFSKKEKPAKSTVNSSLISAREGGTLKSKDLKVTMKIPAGALPEDMNVSVGVKGDEPKTVANPHLQVVGQPFTITIPSDTLYKPIILTFPKPEGYTNFENSIVYAYNGTGHYVMFFEEKGDSLEVEVDIVKWPSIPKQNSPQKVRSANQGYGQGDVVIGVGTIAPMPDMGDKQLIGLYSLGLKNISGFGYMSNPVTAPLNEDHKILLMIHGWTSATYIWNSFMDSFSYSLNPRSTSGYTDYWVFGYNSSRSIDDNGKDLADLLKKYVNGADLDIVAHSMGGLVARAAIENHDCDELVNNLVTLGTPHLGIDPKFQKYAASWSLTDENVVSDVNSLKKEKNIKTLGFYDMLPYKDFIQRLKNNTITISYCTIAAINDGDGYYGVSSSYVAGPDDGIVAVSSAHGVKEAEKVTVKINEGGAHSIMPENDDVITAVLNYLNTKSPKTRIYPYEAYETLINMGMPIWSGVRPPRISGTFLFSPNEMKATNIANDNYPIGKIVLDEIIQITPLSGSLVAVKTKDSQGGFSESKSARIEGNDKNFTIRLVSKNYQGSASIELAEIYTGTYENGEIKDMNYGFVCIDDTQRENSDFVRKGHARVFFDNDFVTKPTSWESTRGIPVPQFSPGIKHQSTKYSLK